MDALVSIPRSHRRYDAARRVRLLTDAEVLSGARGLSQYRDMYRREAKARGLTIDPPRRLT
jgi:hypothetical protein